MMEYAPISPRGLCDKRKGGTYAEIFEVDTH